ncbi:uncharacterized protein PV09_00131 [Verruconis gallopava]|uniref:Mitochondrial import inner membrane translocase subunit TIM50 n=1 Tax=Verruconis gallopava TaxID=253628 RepID=A0A0D2AR65_9PEZI|nr:uncharacterized protein PV09_00131 [Verruconis gallopava]KIW09203.1 hypothetical protein PV09_00131 [Verruconis gallopava]
MLIARSLLRTTRVCVVRTASTRPVLASNTSLWLRYKSDSSFPSKPGNSDSTFKSPQELQYDPVKRLNRQQAKQDASSEKPAEFDEGAAPSKGATLEGQRQSEGSGHTEPRASVDTSSKSVGGSETPEAPQRPSQPLPDLRHGIPSTFAEEFLNKSAASTQGEADSAGQHRINLDDEARHERSSGFGDGAEREQGELPKSAYQTSIDKRRDAMAKWFYIAFGVLLTTGSIYLGRNWDTKEEEEAHPEAPSGWTLPLFWERIKARMNSQRSYYTEPTFPKLLPEMNPPPPYTLVLSLEDMLIHSEWTREHGWRTAKRPGLDYFLGYLSQYYELVLFTTMPMAYADQIVKKLDPYHFMTWPLFREATRYENGQYVKDLSYLNRPLSKTIIIDTKKEHVKNQPENAIILKPWTGDPKDKELVELIPYLEHIAAIGVPDVRASLKAFEGKHIPTEFAARLERSRAEFNKQLEEERAKKSKRSAGSFISNMLGLKPQGGMTYDGQTRVADELAQGKMLADQIRENGIRQYQRIEKEIRENGEKWLAEEKELEKKMMAEQMKSWQKGWFGFGGSSSEKSTGA